MTESDIINLYGSRETGGITRDGVVYPGISVKLKDVPDLGYFSSSVPPQGEICVHSPRLINGYILSYRLLPFFFFLLFICPKAKKSNRPSSYWNEEALTKDNFVEMDGKKFYRTGDIGEMQEIMYVNEHKQLRGGRRKRRKRYLCLFREPNGKKVIRLKVIDRVSSMLKLSSGEWVSTGRIPVIVFPFAPLSSLSFSFSSSSSSHLPSRFSSFFFDDWHISKLS